MAVVVVIVWYLDLQLPMQSVPITNNVVSSKLAHREVYSITTLCDKVCPVILWLSVVLAEETKVHGENHRPAASH
jgi:hypothetical protein